MALCIVACSALYLEVILEVVISKHLAFGQVSYLKLLHRGDALIVLRILVWKFLLCANQSCLSVFALFEFVLMFESYCKVFYEGDAAKYCELAEVDEVEVLALVTLLNCNCLVQNLLPLCHQHQLQQSTECLLCLLQKESALVELLDLLVLRKQVVFDIHFEALLVNHQQFRFLI